MNKLGSQSFVQLKAHVEHCVGAGDIAGALDVVRHFVELVINDPAAVGHVLASEELDQLVRFIGESYRRLHPRKAGVHKGHGTVILMTEAQGHGGHIEVAKDLLETGVLGRATVVLTDTFDRDQSGGLAFSSLPGVDVELVRGGGTSLERLRRLDDLLAALAPAKIVVLVHHQDGTAIAALHALPDTENVVFVHHADHNLCLGASDGRFQHVDLHPMGFHACRDRHLRDNLYWPLTVRPTKLDASAQSFMGQGGLVSCASGREAKFDASNYRYDYFQLLAPILLATRGRHVHIGPLSQKMLTRITTDLRTAGIDPTRFTHIPWVQSLATALVEQQVDVYLTSFPLGGGKSVIEAMSVGVPLIMHENYHARLLSGVDLGYPQAFVWRDDAQLLLILGRLTRDELERHSRLAREHFQGRHTLQALAAAVSGPAANASAAQPLRPYTGNALQAFLDNKRHDQEQGSASQHGLTETATQVNDLLNLNHDLTERLAQNRSDLAERSRELESVSVTAKHLFRAILHRARLR